MPTIAMIGWFAVGLLTGCVLTSFAAALCIVSRMAEDLAQTMSREG